MRAWHLKLQDPWIAKHFNEEYHSWIMSNALSHWAYALETKAAYPLSTELAVEYEKLDQLKMQGIQLTDHQCHKLPMGKVPWSPQLQVLRNQLGYWQLVIKKVAGRKVSSKLINCTYKQGKLPQ